MASVIAESCHSPFGFPSTAQTVCQVEGQRVNLTFQDDTLISLFSLQKPSGPEEFVFLRASSEFRDQIQRFQMQSPWYEPSSSGFCRPAELLSWYRSLNLPPHVLRLLHEANRRNCKTVSVSTSWCACSLQKHCAYASRGFS